MSMYSWRRSLCKRIDTSHFQGLAPRMLPTHTHLHGSRQQQLSAAHEPVHCGRRRACARCYCIVELAPKGTSRGELVKVQSNAWVHPNRYKPQNAEIEMFLLKRDQTVVSPRSRNQPQESCTTFLLHVLGASKEKAVIHNTHMSLATHRNMFPSL